MLILHPIFLMLLIICCVVAASADAGFVVDLLLGWDLILTGGQPLPMFWEINVIAYQGDFVSHQLSSSNLSGAMYRS
jgi:hypothetical protein